MLPGLKRLQGAFPTDAVIIPHSHGLHLRIGEQRAVGVVKGQAGQGLPGGEAGRVVRLKRADEVHLRIDPAQGDQRMDVHVPQSAYRQIHG